MLEIVDRRNRLPAPMVQGKGYRLQAEWRWLVRGDPALVAQVQVALQKVATVLSPSLLELTFGNSVGWYEAGPLGTLEVVSGKWTENDYEKMLQQLMTKASALPYSVNTAASLPYERKTVSEDDVLYHAFVYLRHLLGSAERPRTALLGSLNSILAQPHRKTTRRRKVVPAEAASRLSPRVLADVAAGRWPLHKASHLHLARYTGGLVPEFIEDSVLADDVDTAENRFIKNFLAFCTGILQRMSRLTLTSSRLRENIEEDCRFMTAVLQPIVQHGMWRFVKRMTHFPAASTVLQRRHDYRVILGHYAKLRLGVQLPLAVKEIKMLLEVKDIALLYEVWSCFALIDAVEMVLGKPSRVEKVQYSELEATLGWSLQAAWADGTRVHYNPHFSITNKKGRRSYSVSLRPDIVLEVPLGPNSGLHIFDAKFKLDAFSVLITDPEHEEKKEERRGRFKRVDLYKMHAYRDALEASTCWVLYPGTEVCFFDKKAGMITDMDDLPAVLSGVGGCVLPPDKVGENLQKIITNLCQAPVDALAATGK